MVRWLAGLVAAGCASEVCPELEQVRLDDEGVAGVTGAELRRLVDQASGPVDVAWRDGTTTTFTASFDVCPTPAVSCSGCTAWTPARPTGNR